MFALFMWRLTVVCLHVQYDRLIDSGYNSQSHCLSSLLTARQFDLFACVLTDVLFFFLVSLVCSPLVSLFACALPLVFVSVREQ